ncbi:MAG TPA: prephenate dehydratase domain-containing protein [Candidatus Limnocylindrales bacterium]|nr:prephenate dehydratase domain-containing protein [Candidatus Limnocylindrales bacterium]
MSTDDRPIAYSGERGAFAEDAAVAAFGAGAALLPVGGFRDVFEAVRDGRAAAGVVPIENLVNGTIRETYDLLLEHDLVIDAEVAVPVELSLAALPGTRLDGIQRVYSHIQALGQAERYLRAGGWQLLTTYNTAGAGRFIIAQGDHAAGAVLSARAAEVLGLEVLATSIQDVPDNRTKFLVVVREPGSGGVMPSRGGEPEAGAASAGAASAGSASAAWRTTIAFGVRNEPGTLLQALQIFAGRGINLSKLESRPSRSAAWEYVFWADLDTNATDPDALAALDELRAAATMVRVFGSYRPAA